MTTEHSSNVLYLPTEAACKAYGIPRAGISASNNSNAKFLTGPQFKNIKASGAYSGPSDVTVDEIILDFIKNQPYTMKFDKQANTAGSSFQRASFETRTDNSPLFTVRIAPNTTDWVNLTVKHQWEKPGGLITSLFESVTSLISAGNGILTKLLNVSGDSLAEQTIQVDQAEAYKSTDNVEFNVPFLLWSSGSTVENWIDDIYFPIMLLTAWSHPKRSTTLNIDKAIVDGLNAASKATNGATPSGDDNKEVVKGMIDKVNKIYPGARISVLDPPSYVVVSHSSGLFKFNRCVITSFNFKYMDPWVRATSSNDLNGANKSLLSKSLPMRAECSIGLRSVEKVYADDWLSMYDNGIETLGSAGGKVTVEFSKGLKSSNLASDINSQPSQGGD